MPSPPLTLLLLTACGWFEEPPAPSPERPPNLILVTLDTTRADALGVYGGPEGVSPVFDRLAETGVRFQWALSHAPTTLNSHASMMTGLDPHGHEVPHNGVPLPADKETVAQRLSAAGWDTLAVIAASAVDASTGLDRGFRRYDDDVDIAIRTRYESRGDDVVDRALAVVERRREDSPLFLWVHFYDAHSPYVAPEPWGSRFTVPGHEPVMSMSGGPEADGFGALVRSGEATQADMDHFEALYHGEVAYQDHQLGRLLEGLGAAGVLDRAHLVIAGDHGEMFYESMASPLGHGPDVDLPVTHVPLVVTGLGEVRLQPRVVPDLVALSDVGPTLLGLAGEPPTLGQGRDLGPRLRGQPLEPRPVFLEATKPHHSDPEQGWNNSRAEKGVAEGGQLYIRPPYSTSGGWLFSVAPGQPKLDDPDREAQLDAALEGWVAESPPFRDHEMSPAVRRALEALGYVE